MYKKPVLFWWLPTDDVFILSRNQSRRLCRCRQSVCSNSTAVRWSTSSTRGESTGPEPSVCRQWLSSSTDGKLWSQFCCSHVERFPLAETESGHSTVRDQSAICSTSAGARQLRDRHSVRRFRQHECTASRHESNALGRTEIGRLMFIVVLGSS